MNLTNHDAHVLIWILLIGFLGIASVTDVVRNKIYNWNTYPGILTGFVANGLLFGSVGIERSFAGFLICGLIMLVCFLIFNMGGGDLKLIAMMGSFLGAHDGIEAMLWTFVIGSFMGIAILIWKFGIVHILRGTLHHLGLMFRTRSVVPLSENERHYLQNRWLFLAPSALLAALMVWFRPI